jgi:hypothetical protein
LAAEHGDQNKRPDWIQLYPEHRKGENEAKNGLKNSFESSEKEVVIAGSEFKLLIALPSPLTCL